MDISQAVDYLETVESHGIQPRDVSRAMFRLIRAAARLCNREYGGMDGYYGGEYEGVRARPGLHTYYPARFRDIIPQSERLLAMTESLNAVPDPWGPDAILRIIQQARP